MALPEDLAARLRCYRNALRNCDVEGYVAAKPRVEEWLRKELSQFSWRQIRRELHKHVESGGTIDEQVEKRPEYRHYEFHYDLRVLIGGRKIYFETILECEDANHPDGSMIVVVNVHDV